MAAYSDILFAKIALGNRLVTAAQVQQALAAQEQAPGKGLGDLLVQRGLITREQSQRVQRAQALTQFVRAERIYAKIVVERKLVPTNVLRECFAQQEQSQHKARLGQLLVDRRVLTPAQNDEVVEEQLVRLAEETARIEEAGLAAELGDSDDHGGLDGLTQVRAATDLEGATFKKAVGPRGLLEGSSNPQNQAVTPPSSPANRAQPRPQPARPAPAPAGPGADALVGRTIASRYRVLEKVGEGGMGTVYKAEHCLMEKTVALKILHPSLVSSKASLERFRREIRAASKFQHKHVIQIYDAGEGEGGLFYMAMEFAAGESLEDRIRRSTRLSLNDATTLMRQTLGAVAEAHKKGIVHRDLKSANIMIVKGKEGEDLVKVMDFGIAKMVLESGEGHLDGAGGGSLYKTQEGVVTGTPQYMSPEQCSGEAVDARSDLYSLGVILFEMLTGELPFKSNTPMGFLGKHIVEPPPPPSSLRPDVPQALEAVVLRLLEKRPSDRYGSAEEVLTALEARGASQRGGPRPATPSPDVRPASSPAGPQPAVNQLMRTIDVEEPRTLAVGAPSPYAASSPAASGPTFATSAVNSALTAQALASAASAQATFAPAPLAAPARQGTSAPVVIGLVLLLLFLATVSTLVAVVATTPDADPVAQARELLAKDDAAGAIALLEAPAARGEAPAVELLRDAQRRKGDLDKAARLAEDAAGLERAWRQGKRLADGDEAAKLLELALGLKDDGAWRARRDVLLAELTKARTTTEKAPVTEKAPSTERPPVSETERPLATEKPPATEPPGTEVKPATERPALDPVAQGRAALDEVNAALVRGQLAEADAALARAEEALPDDHRDLEVARRALRAAHLVADARAIRASDPARARTLLAEALAAQPDKQAQKALEQELAQVAAEAERAAASAEGQPALDAALRRALAAALELDLPAATKAADEAKALARRLGAEGLARPRAASVAALAPLAPDLAAARDALRELLATPPPAGLTAGKVQAACTRLAEGVARLAALPADAPLVDGLRQGLEAELARGRELAKALEAAANAPPPAVDERLQRFLDMLERARGAGAAGAPADEVESARSVSERLERLRQLKEHPAYTKGLLAAADKAWVDEQLAQAVRRKGVWDELGPGMVAVPGGSWRPPGAEADVTLPAPWYYAGDAEVTCAQWDAFCRATGRARPQSFPGRTDEPVRLISLADAQAYCAWRSKDKKKVTFRLPTEVEWERAARGRSGREFPWGEQFEDWRKDYAAVAGQLLRVKSFERDRNDLGLYDLVGNVAELTSSKRGEQLVVRGGSMSSERKSSGASAAVAVKKGDEVSPTIGLRVFAVERP